MMVSINEKFSGKYGGGRYPDQAVYYDGLEDITLENLSQYATSDYLLDRIAAMVYVKRVGITLPEVWVVIPDPEKPDSFGNMHDLEYHVSRNTWSAHADEADAIAWRDMFQSKADDQLARHPWWGEDSRRHFIVVKAAGAPASQLRMPGAEPRTEAFQ